MAKAAGCFAVWAKYGAHTAPAMYERLVRVSHWTPEDVSRKGVCRARSMYARTSLANNHFLSSCRSSLAR